jgi:GPI mannosyltransferase 3
MYIASYLQYNMVRFQNKQLTAISYVGLAVLIITAIFSSGYNHFDEHFQILEFCNYKLGNISANTLPWEYHEKLRPGIQPLIAYFLAKCLYAFNVYSPFTLSLICRLLMAICSWIAIQKIIAAFSYEFNSDRLKKLYSFASYFIWFAPYIGIRFSAENFSSILFFTAIATLYRHIKTKQHIPTVTLLICGFLFGIALFSRIQVLFALIGLGIWLIFQERQKRDWLILSFSFSIAIILGICTDYWLYNQWTFTPYNYFDANILQHKASSFGTSPWYQYFIYFSEAAVPPLSIALLYFFFIGLKNKAGHLLGVICICFILGHIAIAHKELRFLFPILPAFIYITVDGMGAFFSKYVRSKPVRHISYMLIITNFVVLIYKMFTPASAEIPYYQTIYNHSNKETSILFITDNSPYNKVGLELNFYKPEDLKVMKIKSKDDIPIILRKVKCEKAFILDVQILTTKIGKYNIQCVYSPLPEWLLNVNYNNWQHRNKMWRLYEIYL